MNNYSDEIYKLAEAVALRWDNKEELIRKMIIADGYTLSQIFKGEISIRNYKEAADILVEATEEELELQKKEEWEINGGRIDDI